MRRHHLATRRYTAAPRRRLRPPAAALTLTLIAASGALQPVPAAAETATATPIHHLVVIFQENVSFDHYFGTYPNAANIDGQPFIAQPGTPVVNGLSAELLLRNPNSMQPVRLGGAGQQVTCDQDDEYTNEQKAFNGGAMDRFVENTEGKNCDPTSFNPPGLVMDYYDGNTVTALWNYAQRYAMSDNFYNTTFGPSALGAINLVSGQTHGVVTKFTPGGGFPDHYVIDNAGNGQGTLINDSQPYGDDCSDRDQVQFSAANKNIGDLLNAKGVTWGFFQGGFKPTATKPDGTAMCGATHNIGAVLGGTGTSGAGFDAGPNEGAVADAGTRLRDAAGDLYLPCWVLVSALYVAVAVVVVPPVSHFDRMRRFGSRGDW